MENRLCIQEKLCRTLRQWVTRNILCVKSILHNLVRAVFALLYDRLSASGPILVQRLAESGIECLGELKKVSLLVQKLMPIT